MRTPRPQTARAPRGIGTLIGNGWLRENPRNLWPHEWNIRGRSALRKCMFLPVPPHFQQQMREAQHVSPAAMPPQQPAARFDAPVHRQKPGNNALMFPAVTPEDLQARKRALYNDEKAKALGKGPAPKASWFEDPVALGTLLILCPPIGLAAVWSSKRYSTDARWALTVMTGLTMCLAAAVVVAIVALRG